MLFVRASRQSIAAATSLGGASVDQRLPTRRISPRRSRSCRRASALSRLRPAARAAIAVENEPGRLRAPLAGGPGAGRSRACPGASAAGRAARSARGRLPGPARGSRPTGGSLPKRNRQLRHKTIHNCTPARAAGPAAVVSADPPARVANGVLAHFRTHGGYTDTSQQTRARTNAGPGSGTGISPACRQ